MSAPPAFLIGLIGAGIQASRSPALHEHEGAAQGFRYAYRLLDVERMVPAAELLARLLTAAQLTGFSGLNITHPFKQQVVPLLDTLSDDARALGAVNTVVLRDGKRVGHNTDGWGFARSFREGLTDAPLHRVVQLGAGGAGAAVAHAALTLGTQQLTLFDVETGRATNLAESLCGRFGEGRAVAGHDLPSAMAAADGLIHATPTGMAAHPGLPLPPDLLRPDLWVAEIVYFPLETALLTAARRIGCRTLDGGGMAVYQAVEAFRLFTDTPPDAERMKRHFAQMMAEDRP
ncbi:MAG: shikimate dehydrogenase [Burkholderiales bacterium]|nr:shikimate dehydrogenase [Burkholderiales bacterium]